MIRFYSVDNRGNAVRMYAVLKIEDPLVGRPSTTWWNTSTNFRPDSGEVRDGWEEGNSQSFYGPGALVDVTVKRETDGWTIPTSSEFRALYPDPNDGTGDYAIFTISINKFL
jgi:hypothetical protein